MATKNIMVRAGADFSAITKQSKKASTSVVSMVSSINQSTAKLTAAASSVKSAFGAIGVGVSLAAIISGAKEALSSYQDQETAQTKLAAVMRNTMAASREEYQAILDLAKAQQKLGVIGDAVQLSGAQELATYLGLSSSLKTLLPVMNDMLAQQYGLNATQENAVNIAAMMGKVMNGQTGALSQYGYSFTEAQEAILKYGDEEARAATLAEGVEESVGGMNAALAATPSGRLTQVKNTLGDIKEEFGRAVLTIATTFLPLLNKVVEVLSAVAAVANRVAQAIANVFGKKTTTTAATGGVSSSLSDGLDTVTDSADGATDALTGTTKAAEKLKAMAWDELNIISSSTSSGTGTTAAGLTDALAGDYTSIDWGSTEEAADSCTWLEKALRKLQDTFSKFDTSKLSESWGKLKESGKELWSVIKEYLGDAWENVLVPLGKWYIEDAAPRSVQLLADVIKDLANGLELIRPVVVFLEKTLVPIIELIGSTVLQLLQIVWDTLSVFASSITALFTGNYEDFKYWDNRLMEDIQELFNLPNILFPDLCASIDGWFTNLWDSTTGWFNKFGERLKSYWEIDKALWKAQFDWVIDGSRDMISKIIGAVQTAIERIRSFISNAKNIVSGAVSAVKSAFSWTNTSSTSSTVTGRAGGGFVGSAELFYANENGIPEYIGRMGSNTAVANREQITEGIAQAVLSAIRDTGLLESVRDIADSSERTARKELTLGRPSSETGRWVQQSINQYNTVRGRA